MDINMEELKINTGGYEVSPGSPEDYAEKMIGFTNAMELLFIHDSHYAYRDDAKQWAKDFIFGERLPGMRVDMDGIMKHLEEGISHSRILGNLPIVSDGEIYHLQLGGPVKLKAPDGTGVLLNGKSFFNISKLIINAVRSELPVLNAPEYGRSYEEAFDDVVDAVGVVVQRLARSGIDISRIVAALQDYTDSKAGKGVFFVSTVPPGFCEGDMSLSVSEAVKCLDGIAKGLPELEARIAKEFEAEMSQKAVPAHTKQPQRDKGTKSHVAER